MSCAKAFFITGTDTDAGKTLVSCAILLAARASGLSTAALKPVAAGVAETPLGRHNTDVVALASCCSPKLALETINPVCFDEPIAPHIAASRTGMILDAVDLAKKCRLVLDKEADLTLVEGAGGWKVPLSHDQTMADLVKHLDIPVILVVGMRLGCLNHALLTAQSILADGVTLAGWIANRVDPAMQAYPENLATLKVMMPVPMVAEIPWVGEDNLIAGAATHINMEKIIQTD